MKKKCNGCRALISVSSSRTGAKKCSLGYNTKDGMELFGVTVETIPTEECPKPKKNSEYIYLLQMRSK